MKNKVDEFNRVFLKLMQNYHFESRVYDACVVCGDTFTPQGTTCKKCCARQLALLCKNPLLVNQLVDELNNVFYTVARCTDNIE